jgi:hypothetical protein
MPFFSRLMIIRMTFFSRIMLKRMAFSRIVLNRMTLSTITFGIMPSRMTFSMMTFGRITSRMALSKMTQYLNVAKLYFEDWNSTKCLEGKRMKFGIMIPSRMTLTKMVLNIMT